MSEFINNNKRVEKLLSFSKGIINGEDAKKLINKYKEAIDNMTPHDMQLEGEKRLLDWE